jgi:hypothetical protein
MGAADEPCCFVGHARPLCRIERRVIEVADEREQLLSFVDGRHVVSLSWPLCCQLYSSEKASKCEVDHTLLLLQV